MINSAGAGGFPLVVQIASQSVVTNSFDQSVTPFGTTGPWVYDLMALWLCFGD